MKTLQEQLQERMKEIIMQKRETAPQGFRPFQDGITFDFEKFKWVLVVKYQEQHGFDVADKLTEYVEL